MAVYNTSGSISALLNNIYEIALLTAREQSVMSSLVRTFGGISNGQMNGRVWATYSGGTFGTVSEASDVASSSQAFTPSAAGTFTPALYAATYILTDLRIASDPFGVARDAGVDLGQLAAVGVDTDLVGLFTSLTGGTVGATTTALTWAAIQKAAAYVRANKASGPYFCVLHPAQWYDLTAATSVPALTQSQDLMSLLGKELAGQFYMASWSGIHFFTDANITDSGGTVSGGLFSRDAIGLDVRRPFLIEPQRDASVGGGATELNASMVYAKGVYRPTWGVLVKGASY
jgi:hypothetical protein